MTDAPIKLDPETCELLNEQLKKYRKIPEIATELMGGMYEITDPKPNFRALRDAVPFKDLGVKEQQIVRAMRAGENRLHRELGEPIREIQQGDLIIKDGLDYYYGRSFEEIANKEYMIGKALREAFEQGDVVGGSQQSGVAQAVKNGMASKSKGQPGSTFPSHSGADSNTPPPPPPLLDNPCAKDIPVGALESEISENLASLPHKAKGAGNSIV